MSLHTAQRYKLSETDKKILRVLLDHDGTEKTVTLAKKIGIPRSTVLRRRLFLEKRNIITSSYFMDLAPYGFRRVEFLVETGSGMTERIAKQIMKLPEVTAVAKTIGEHLIDLIASLIISDNAEILNLAEKIKAMHGVKNVIWTEIIREDRKKRTVPDHVINSL